MLKQMPKFVRIGRFLYLLRNIYLISKGKLLLKTETTGTRAYVLNTSLVNRNKRALEPEDGSIILNDINSLIEYSLEFCKLIEGIEYKVNVFDDLYHNVENDKQLLNYNGNVLYVKISETAHQKEQMYFNKNSMNNTTIKEETNEDIYYHHGGVPREWNNNIGNVSSTDNGYVNSSRIIYHNNNNNTSSTYMLKKSNSDKSFESILPYCLKENDNKKKRVRLLLTNNQSNKMNANNSNSNNHKQHKSNAHLLSSPLQHRNNSSYYIKASFYPSNTNERCNSSKCNNQSFINGDECYYNYSSGTVTLNNNNNVISSNKPQFNSIKTETIPKTIPIKHIKHANLLNRNIKTNTTHPIRNNHIHNNQLNNNNNNYYTINDYNSKSNTNSTSYIPTKVFPSRGRLVLPLLHKANSFQSISHDKHKRSKSISYTTFASKKSFVLNTTVQFNDNKPSHLNKVNFMKTILFSQHLPSNNTISHSINTNNFKLTNTKLKSIYNEFLYELRYCILHNINIIISDYIISLAPPLINSFQYTKSYQHIFPYTLCAKEFILYSYLCYKCLQDNTILNKVYNAFESINEFEQSEIVKSIETLKCEFKQLITKCRRSNSDNDNEIAKYVMDNNNNNKMSIHKGFFVLFVLCGDYFDVLQYMLMKIVLQVLGLNELKYLNYESFSYYYLYFKCFDLITNEQKFQFIKQMITYINNNDSIDIRNKLYDILRIDKKVLVQFLGKESSNNNKYFKIDMLYLNLINYFTYQHI